MKAESKDPLPGTVVNGKYRVLALLAHGGMGKIYRAEQVPLGRPVALKVLRTKYADELDDDPHFHKRFFVEASILSKLQHANIVTLYDYGRIEDVATEQYFMAMELLRGETLAQRLRAVGALAPAKALRLVAQIAKGLREAHKLGIVHRDLKPSNIMLVPEEDGAEVAKILDFGIGKMLASDSEDLTVEGAFVGSPRYMAPEQIREGRVDARSDVYSLGVMMYECFSGQLPFEGETTVGIMMAHCNAPVPPMRTRSPNVAVPEIVERFVRLCLEKDPKHRPQTMEELARGLRSCEAELFGSNASALSSPMLGVGSPSSGSGPTLRSSGPELATAAFEAPTLTGVAPATASLPPSHPAGSGPLDMAPTGTHKSLTRSWLPAAPLSDAATSVGARVKWIALVVVVAALGASAIGLVLYVLPRRVAAHAPPRPAASTRTTFTLLIESMPEGAEVAEGEMVFGATPLHMPIERASLRHGPRKLVVRLAGYAPYTLLQSDSDSDVRVMAELVAAPPVAPTDSSTAATPTTAKPTPSSAKQSTPTPPAARPPNPDLDIKLKR